MVSSMKQKNKCQSGKCNLKNHQNQNGKGDKPRPVSKKQYDKNYESINWKRK